MITLPEELLKCSTKELEQLLNKNIYTSKYLVNYDDLLKVHHKYKNQLICSSIGNNSNTLYSIDLTRSDVEPLTTQKFYELKSKSNSNYLNTCSNESFKSYLEKLANDIFGEDRVDVTITNDKYIDLIIYFPEITITNSVELSHKIYDIYVKFRFETQYSDNGKSIYNRHLYIVYITRTTYSIAELNNDYTFSHCNSSAGRFDGETCFGRTELRTIKDNLVNGKLLGNLSSILLSFEEYLKWESLEGTPYRYIDKLKNIRKYKEIGCSDYTFEKYYKNIVQKITNFKYQFDLFNGEYKIHLDNSTKEEIEELLTNSFPDKCYYLVNNKSYTLNSDYNHDYSKYENRFTEVKFKRIKKKFKILNDDITNEIEPIKRIHRTILNQVITLIENNYYKYIINKKLEEVC